MPPLCRTLSISGASALRGLLLKARVIIPLGIVIWPIAIFGTCGERGAPPQDGSMEGIGMDPGGNPMVGWLGPPLGVAMGETAAPIGELDLVGRLRRRE